MSISTENIKSRFDYNVDYILECFVQALNKAGEFPQNLTKDNLIGVYQAAANLTIAETIERMGEK